MPVTTPDDYALMDAIATGDERAMQVLYDRHAPLVYTLCLRIVHDRSEAEDLLIDVFYELWAKCDRYDAARGSPLTYLLTLSRSRAIDRRRSCMRRRTIQTQSNQIGSDHNGGNGHSGNGTEVGTSAGSPVKEALSKELGERIRAAMNKLEPAHRQAVELSFFDDLSHTQIAERLGKPLGTVKTYIRQGLIRLREFIRMD